MRIKELTDVVDGRLCIGCGACAYICPREKIELWDFLNEGIRPVVQQDDCSGCQQCLDVCPAARTEFRGKPDSNDSSRVESSLVEAAFVRDWGQVLEVWEGHASDSEIRFKGSSGGALTALAAYCIESGGMHGVLHIAQDPDDPIRNRTRLSRTREELIAATGSRYSPASVCDGLGLVENASASCVVIGKPGEIAALSKAEKLRPALKARVGLTLSFFCAETPPTFGTTSLLDKLNIKSDSVADLRYRGFGWPGHFAPTVEGESAPRAKLTYKESWAFLQRYRPWSVHLWPDGSGELADISCGDPWYEQPDGINPGSSLVVVRTERGRQILQAAMRAGYLDLKPAEAWKLPKSQANLSGKKNAVWGRLLAMRLFGMPVPQFSNAHLFRCWLQLSIKDKVMSVVGTIRRIFTRKLYQPLKLDRTTAVRVPTPSAPMKVSP